MRRLEDKFAGRIEFRAVDIDDRANAGLMTQYRFRGQPQFVIANPNGDAVVTRNGFVPYETLESDILSVLQKTK